jgi:hypothetical protein
MREQLISKVDAISYTLQNVMNDLKSSFRLRGGMHSEAFRLIIVHVAVNSASVSSG